MVFAVWRACFVVFPALAMLHLYVSPYTKVEESFNLQAIHDILKYGVPLSDAAFKFRTYFDHMTFPGAVPRTFIGALVTAAIAKPRAYMLDMQGLDLQIHVRSVVGVMNAGALAWFARSVERAYGPIAALWYVVLQGSQFHIWYYSSRTLPNMFAFFLSTTALAYLLPNPTSSLGPIKRRRLGLYLLTIATVVFRSELALLLGAQCLWMLFKSETLATKAVLIRSTILAAIIPGTIVALLLTVTIDTYFWQSKSYLWPEMSAFLSNVFPQPGSQGASAWGTQPFYWYFVVALPRLLMSQFFMIDPLWISASSRTDLRYLDNLFPSYVYMIIYSLLPHKETRFLFPILPLMTLTAALRCTHLTINAHKNFITKLLLYGAIGSTIVTALLSHAILLPLSAQNYPGGQALQHLHEYYRQNWPYHIPQDTHYAAQPQIRVHLTNLALQSGVTRFLEQPQMSENLDAEPQQSVSAKLVETHDEYTEYRDPLVIPGSPDGKRSALTIYPKIPKASGSPSNPSYRQRYQHPTWIYDKSSNSTEFLQPDFWSQFDFVIVENPAHVIGAWEIIEEVKAIGKPSIMQPTDRRHKILGAETPPEAQSPGTVALLRSMYPDLVSQILVRLHNTAHDLLRQTGLTGGYWIEVPLKTRLYILKRSVSGTAPNPAQQPDSQVTDVVEPNKYEDHHDIHYIEGQAGNAERKILNMEEMGPLVVNKDGTLSRLDNWAQMTPQEKKRTVEYLKKRNMIRMKDAVE